LDTPCFNRLRPRTTVPAAIAAGHLKLAETGDARASSRWFAALEQVPQFRLLDAYQLVKHFLGLRLTYPEQLLTLVYLYWEPANAARIEPFARHRAEIDRFASLVERDDRCRFSALSYSEHWAELAAGSNRPEWLDGSRPGLQRRDACGTPSRADVLSGCR
jgi:hypothetical protein